jgi:hypothetical protein
MEKIVENLKKQLEEKKATTQEDGNKTYLKREYPQVLDIV